MILPIPLTNPCERFSANCGRATSKANNNKTHKRSTKNIRGITSRFEPAFAHNERTRECVYVGALYHQTQKKRQKRKQFNCIFSKQCYRNSFNSCQ